MMVGWRAVLEDAGRLDPAKNLASALSFALPPQRLLSLLLSILFLSISLNLL